MTCFHVVNPVKLHTKGVRILHSIYDVILKYVAMLVPYYYSGTSHNGGGHGSALWHLKLLSYDGLSMWRYDAYRVEPINVDTRKVS